MIEHDAVADNESAVELQGEDVLAQIARELVGVAQRDTKIDWTVRDDVRAKPRPTADARSVHQGVPDVERRAEPSEIPVC